MKRILIALLAILVLLSATACDLFGSAETEKPTEQTTERGTERPSDKETEKPTEKETEKPTEKPTEKETGKGTDEPTTKKPDPIPVEPGAMTELSPTAYYGYQYLEGLDQPELLWLYGIFVENADDCNAVITLDSDVYSVTTDQLSTVFHCYVADYPQHFWMGGAYTCEYNPETDVVSTVTPQYAVSKADLADARTAFDSAVDALLDGIELLPDAYAKECAVHDRIVLNAQYDSTYEAPMTHSAYGNAVNKTSVCDGYAKLFQYLMYRCGIPCIRVTGYAGEDHAWNAVNLNGDWYFVDVTWDDPVGQADDAVSHEYLNCTGAFFDVDHEAQDNPFPIPAATVNDYNYFEENGFKADLTVASLADAIRIEHEAGISGSFEIALNTPSDPATVGAFLSEHINDFCDAVGTALGTTVTNLSYSLSASGRVIKFTF